MTFDAALQEFKRLDFRAQQASTRGAQIEFVAAATLALAARERLIAATPPSLAFYATHGYAPDSPHAVAELIGAGRIDEALRAAAGVS